jgi:DUF971 family protein
MYPVKIRVVENKSLEITWDDNKRDLLDLKLLRKLCPCATCLAERDKQSKMYIPIFSKNQTTIKSINQVGKYAIQIIWSDGHSTGIYEYPFLKNLTEKINS